MLNGLFAGVCLRPRCSLEAVLLFTDIGCLLCKFVGGCYSRCCIFKFLLFRDVYSAWQLFYRSSNELL
jgi:hypothetical protein